VRRLLVCPTRSLTRCGSESRQSRNGVAARKCEGFAVILNIRAPVADMTYDENVMQRERQ